MPPKLLAVGISCIDYVATVPSYPAPDTKNVTTSMVSVGGGNAANGAVALSRLGCTVHLITKLYNDANGSKIREEFEEEGVLVSHSQTVEGTTPMSYIVVDEATGSRTIFHTRGSEAGCSQRPPDFDAEVDGVLLDGRLPHLALPAAHAALARRPGIPVVLDCERADREGLDELLEIATVAVCSRSFIGSYGDDELTGLLSFLRAKRVPAAILTLGEQGSVYARLLGTDRSDLPPISSLSELQCLSGSPFHIFKGGMEVAYFHPHIDQATVRDTTGAGDAFQAGLLYALASNKGLSDCLAFASFLGRSNCLGVGARCTPQRDRVPEDLL